MKFLRNNLLILLSVMVFFLLLPGSFTRAQQIPNTQRQALITQIQQQIIQLQQQITQLLGQQQANPGVPVRLKIPKINVDAVIELAGIAPSGEIGAPKDPSTTAWFDLGPRPGDIGNAIIDGHFGKWKNGGGSVFDNLNKLIKGDKIYIEDENGTTFTFVVRELKIYDPAADASSVFNSTDGKPHLNLVTCEGVWIPSQKTFTKRLVVFTDRE